MKGTVLAGLMIFGLTVLVSGMGTAFAGESESPVYGTSQHGESFEGDGGGADFWQAVGTGTLLSERKLSVRKSDAGLDPARWEEPETE